VRHREEAAAEAAVLAAAVRDKALDPAAPDFNQGRGAEAGGGADGGAREGPVCLWAPARVANDLKVARTLVALVDSQRGLRLADNPLLPPAADAGGMAAMATDGQEGADGTANGAWAANRRGQGGSCCCQCARRPARPHSRTSRQRAMRPCLAPPPSHATCAPDGVLPCLCLCRPAAGEGGAAARGGDAAAGEVAANGGGDGSQQQQQQQQQEGQQAPALLRGVLDAIDAEEVSCEGEQALQECLGQLDLLLTWLWRVHGIDYYGGRELLTEAQYGGRHSSSRTLRPPRPEEGEEQDEEEGACGADGAARGGHGRWCGSAQPPRLCCAAPCCSMLPLPPCLTPLLCDWCAAAAPAAKADQERLAREVDAVWQARLGAPDPLLAAAQREEVSVRLAGARDCMQAGRLARCARLRVAVQRLGGGHDTLRMLPVLLQIERRLTDWVESQIHSENEKK
jgi:hypothetical protein